VKNTLKAICAFLLSAALLLPLTGCWDSRELDTLGIVMGIGLDSADEPGKREVTLQFAHVGTGQSGSSPSSGTAKSSSSGASYFNITENGSDFPNALHVLLHSLGRKTNFTHCQAVLIGEEYAKGGVRDALDFFSRYSEPRMDIYLFVVRGNAGKALDFHSSFEAIPSTEIAELIEEPVGSVDKIPISLEDFLEALLSETTAAVLPCLVLKELNGNTGISVDGCAVFTDDRLVGIIPPGEIAGLQWIRGKVKTSNLTVPMGEGNTNIMIMAENAKFRPELRSDGGVNMKVKITADGFLISQSSSADYSNPDNARRLTDAAAQEIHRAVLKTFSAAQSLDADIFGLGEEVRRRYPKEWESMENNWDAIFRSAKIETEITVKMEDVGMITDPILPDKE